MHQLTTSASSSGNGRKILRVVVRYLCANVPGMEAAMKSFAAAAQLDGGSVGIVEFFHKATVHAPSPDPPAVAGTHKNYSWAATRREFSPLHLYSSVYDTFYL